MCSKPACLEGACLERVGFFLVQVTNTYVFNWAHVTQRTVQQPRLKAMKAEATKEFIEGSYKLKMMDCEMKLCSSMVNMIGQDYQDKRKD